MKIELNANVIELRRLASLIEYAQSCSGARLPMKLSRFEARFLRRFAKMLYRVADYKEQEAKNDNNR